MIFEVYSTDGDSLLLSQEIERTCCQVAINTKVNENSAMRQHVTSHRYDYDSFKNEQYANNICKIYMYFFGKHKASVYWGIMQELNYYEIIKDFNGTARVISPEREDFWLKSCRNE